MKTIRNVGIYVPEGRGNDTALERGFALAREVAARITLFSNEDSKYEVATPKDLAVEIVALRSQGARPLRDALEAWNVDILVKAARPSPGSGRVVGGVARSLLRESPCPVWIVRSSFGGPETPVIAAVSALDGSDGEAEFARAKRVISTAAFLAASQARPLVVAHAWSPIGEHVVSPLGRRERDRYLLDYRRWLYKRLSTLVANTTKIPAQVELIRGAPSTAVTGLAERLDSDTIVVGHSGRRGLGAMLFGNAGEDLIDETTSSVVSVVAG